MTYLQEVKTLNERIEALRRYHEQQLHDDILQEAKAAMDRQNELATVPVPLWAARLAGDLAKFRD